MMIEVGRRGVRSGGRKGTLAAHCNGPAAGNIVQHGGNAWTPAERGIASGVLHAGGQQEPRIYDSRQHTHTHTDIYTQPYTHPACSGLFASPSNGET